MTSRYGCPACFSLRVNSSFFKEKFAIWECKQCGTWFVNNVPHQEDLVNIYVSQDYYDLPVESVERIKEENLRRLNTLKAMNLHGSLLDIGCARGAMLDEARLMGFDTYGTELSAKNVELCLQNNHKVIQGGAQNLVDLPVGGFSVITCLDVIEHVESPVDFLERILPLLSEKGCLIISTPNYSGVVAKILGHRDPFLIPPEHLNYFTRKGMLILFKKCGLKVERFVTFGRLTKDEKNRMILKYIPRFLHPVGKIIKYLLPAAFTLLNILKVGLEQEYYLRRDQ